MRKIQKSIGDSINDLATFFKTHKKKIMIGIIFLIILTLIFSATYLFGFLQLVTKGDVIISIEPKQSFVLTDKRDPQDISFHVSIENRFACSALCHYTFKDISSNLIIEEADFIGISGTELFKNYRIIPPQKGTGQKAYEFYVQCQNKKELLCFSGEGERVQSSFMTLGYELSDEEKELMDTTKIRFIEYLNNLNLLDQQTQELVQIGVEHQPFFLSSNLNFFVVNLNDSMVLLVNESDALRDLWEKEEILKLDRNLKESEQKLAELNKTAGILQNIIFMKAEEYNTTRLSLQKYKSLLEDIDVTSGAAIITQDIIDVKGLFVTPFVQIVAEFNSHYSLNDTMQKIVDLENKYLVTNNDFKEKINNKIKIGEATINSSTLYSGSVDLKNSVSSFISFCDTLEKNKIELSNEALLFYNSYCLYVPPNPLDLTKYNFTLNTLPKVNVTIVTRVSSEIFVHNPVCCIFEKCEPCCVDSCTTKKELYPLILIHGHAISEESSISYSLGGFDKIRKKLEQDGFIDAGTVLPTETMSLNPEGYLGQFGKPIVVGTTYYIDAYDENGSLVSVPSKSESIKTYAQRLNQSIKLIKQKTGSDKVNILAYSMGGLVTRQYLVDFGEDSVNKVILMGTPNKGISGKIESFCPIIGSQKECVEMTSTSSFMNSLNKIQNNPKKIKMYTFVGRGCNMDGKGGDGISLAESVELSYALNFPIQGACSSDKTLHEELRNIEKYPKVYDTLKTILSQ